MLRVAATVEGTTIDAEHLGRTLIAQGAIGRDGSGNRGGSGRTHAMQRGWERDDVAAGTTILYD